MNARVEGRKQIGKKNRESYKCIVPQPWMKRRMKLKTKKWGKQKQKKVSTTTVGLNA